MNQSVTFFYNGISNKDYFEVTEVITTERALEQKCHESMDNAEMTPSGCAFQILTAATRKTRIPIVESLIDGTVRWLAAACWSVIEC